MMGPSTTTALSTDSSSRVVGTCRIIVLGAAKPRLVKVMSLLRERESEQSVLTDLTEQGKNTGALQIEYLPCVPTFDSYEDADGLTVRYLVRVDYFGPGGTFKKPASLLPFLDEETTPAANQDFTKEGDAGATEGKSCYQFTGISGVAIGSGIEDENDIAKLEQFIETLCSTATNKPKIESIRPNPEFVSMTKEMEAFRNLSDAEKEEVSRTGSMGPSKMAIFVRNFAHQLIEAVFSEQEEIPEEETSQFVVAPSIDEAKEVPGISLETNVRALPHVDPSKPRYLCRTCRTVLFGEDDLQNPPHVASKHDFSYRKQHHSHLSSASMKSMSSCQSIFLKDGLAWMGDMSAFEGKYSCPKCQSKIGVWNWSGAQCSCGTWVTPAVQVPRSRVDEVSPISTIESETTEQQATLPPRAFVSPVIEH